MKVTAAQYLGMLAVYVVCAIGAILADASLISSTILLFVLPSVWLWWQLRPSWRILVPITIFAFASTLLWETVAYSQGIWYEFSSFDWRVLDIFPVEIIFWNWSFLMFVLLSYEFFTDDRYVAVEHFVYRHVRLAVFVGLITLVSILFVTALSDSYLPYAYAWLLSFTLLTMFGAIALSHTNTRTTLVKALQGTLLLLPFFLVHEAVALFNFHWVFANTNEYLYVVTLFEEIWPIEQLAFYIIVPTWLIVVYELYLDDGE